jgi:hypothetical protein
MTGVAVVIFVESRSWKFEDASISALSDEPFSLTVAALEISDNCHERVLY